ncbi:MAG: hypothetical protein H0T51_05290 [Pirellulales bacterium]|nr:hypothetical protein [Pirellulales bacterium]
MANVIMGARPIHSLDGLDKEMDEIDARIRNLNATLPADASDVEWANYNREYDLLLERIREIRDQYKYVEEVASESLAVLKHNEFIRKQNRNAMIGAALLAMFLPKR